MQVKKARLVEIPSEERDNYRMLKLAQIDEAFRLKSWDKLRFLAHSGFNLSHRLRGVCDERKAQITYLKKQLFEKTQELNKKQTCDACDLVESLRRNLEYETNQKNAYQIKADIYYQSIDELVSQLVLARQSIRQLHEDLAKYIDAPKGENANNPQETSD